jgi:hypothetical protein
VNLEFDGDVASILKRIKLFEDLFGSRNLCQSPWLRLSLLWLLWKIMKTEDIETLVVYRNLLLSIDTTIPIAAAAVSELMLTQHNGDLALDAAGRGCHS